MKIKLLITFIVLISFPTYTFAAGACLIKDKSAQAITDYIKDNRTVIKNITNLVIESKNKKDEQLAKQTKEDKSFLDKETSKITNKLKETGAELEAAFNESASIFNEIFNFNGYYSYFNYYVTFPISNEVPFQVKRDYSLLDKENKGLLEYIKSLDKNGETSIIIEDACKGVTKGLDNCKKELNNKKAKEIVGKLIQNNDKILDLYRNSVMGEDKEFEIKDFLLVDNNFILDIQKNYGREAVNACNSDEGGFFERISKAISDIKIINKNSEDGIQKWKDAYALLIGNKPDEEKKIEKEKLKEYLNNNGVSSDKQAIMMDNLDRYNTEGLSTNNNFISNTFSSTMKKIKKDWALWKKQNIGDTIPKEVEKIDVNYIQKVGDNATISQEIQGKITSLYEKEIPFAAVGDITTENLRSKIIDTHINVQDSINTLEDTIKVSRKVCEAQGGGGKCK